MEAREARKVERMSRVWWLLDLISEVKLLSHVRLCATPWTVAHQTSLSMGFSKQEYWSGLPFWYQLLRFYFEAHWQGDGGRAQICVLICGLVKLL